MQGYANWKSRWRKVREWLRLKRNYIFCSIIGLGLVFVVIYWSEFWDWLRAGGAEATAETNGATLRTMAIVTGGVAGLGLASWRSWIAERQIKLAERGQQNERYQKAADMLGSATYATRMGGIFALERLAKEHPDEFHTQTMDLLASFARLPTKDEALNPIKNDVGDTEDKARPDVVEAVRSIGRRNEKQVKIDQKRDFNNLIDLINVKLHGAYLSMADLSRVDLIGAKLKGAYLSGAKLNGAILLGADLTDANLSGADLSGAELGGVRNLTQKQLDSAKWATDNLPINVPNRLKLQK